MHATRDAGSAAISPPLRIPLSLPMHTLAFSPDSVASYFTTSEQISRSESQELRQKPFPHSSSSPSVISPTLSELPPIPVSTDFARSFFPILDSDSQDAHNGLTSSSSAHGIGADSPVLPSEESHDPGLSPRSRASRRHRAAHNLAPSAADMDAFALSADNNSDINSVRSIPTSFVSDFASNSIGNHESFLPNSAARGRVYRRSSPSLSFCLNMSAETLNLGDDHEGVYGLGDDLVFRPSRRSLRLLARAVPRSKPVSTVIAGVAAHDGQVLKAKRFTKFKALGEKIKKAFGMKSGEPSPGIGVTTTTAVTTVEYKSVGFVASYFCCGAYTLRSNRRNILSLCQRQRISQRTRSGGTNVANPCLCT